MKLISKIVKKVAYAVFKVIPVNRKLILFESHDDFTDSTYEMYKFITNNKKNYKCVWLIERKNRQYVRKYNIVKYVVMDRFSFKSFWYISRCHYNIYTHRNYFVHFMGLKKNLFFINVFHASPFKRVSDFLYDNRDKNSFIVTPTQFIKELITKVYSARENQFIVNGFPRNDILLEKKKTEESILAESFFNLIDFDQTILCMTTWRRNLQFTKDFFADFPLKMSNDNLIQLNEKLKQLNTQIIFKLHPMQKHKDLDKYLHFSNLKFVDNAFLLEHQVELYSLLRLSDALITDYSSVALDYLLINKPIGYILTDLETFKNDPVEGFVFEDPTEHMPGMQIYELKDFFQFLEDVHAKKDVYLDSRRRVNVLFNDLRTVGYSKGLIEKVEALSNNVEASQRKSKQPDKR